MILTPLGIGSSFSTAPVGWTCNLIDRRLLIDVAPQATIQLRKLKTEADAIEAVVITHLHSDHVFGFPFLLATRPENLDPLPVFGPEGTAERLELLCSISFSKAAPEKMEVVELPLNKRGEFSIGDYHLRSVSTEHSSESLGFLITDQAGIRLAYGGDSAWCDGLREILSESDAAMVEMTFIEGGTPDHLSLREHLPKVLETVPEHAPVIITHLGKAHECYRTELQNMKKSLDQQEVERLALVKIAEELRDYTF